MDPSAIQVIGDPSGLLLVVVGFVIMAIIGVLR
jgi:hypothetical protein